MNNVSEQVFILVLMMAAGFIAAKVKIITKEGRGVLTNLVMYIAQPLLVINSFQMKYDGGLLRDMGTVALFGFVSLGAAYLIGSVIWPRRDDEKRRVLWQATIFSNCGFMGYPVLLSLFGSNGVVYGSVYVLAYTVFTWTLGVYIFAGKSGTWKQVLLQPGLIAVVVGILFFVAGVRLPDWAGKAVSGIGSLTTPLAMMIVGALVAEGDFRNVFKDWTLWAASFVRLIALPGIALGALWLLWRFLPGMPGVASPVISSCVLVTAMPIAANVAIFASMYSVKPQYAAQTVLVSTLLAIATVPLWMFAVQYLSHIL